MHVFARVCAVARVCDCTIDDIFHGKSIISMRTLALNKAAEKEAAKKKRKKSPKCISYILYHTIPIKIDAILMAEYVPHRLRHTDWCGAEWVVALGFRYSSSAVAVVLFDGFHRFVHIFHTFATLSVWKFLHTPISFQRNHKSDIFTSYLCCSAFVWEKSFW